MADEEDCGCSLSEEDQKQLDELSVKLYGQTTDTLTKNKPKPAEIKVVAVDNELIFNHQLIGECLTSHEALSPDDIKWALEGGFKSLSDEQISVIVVHMCKDMDIGKFSLCFNVSVDRVILNRDRDTWKSLLRVKSEKAFPEFYAQLGVFTENEKKTIQDMYTTEYNAVYHLVKLKNVAHFPLKRYLIRKCPSFDPESAEIVSTPFRKGGIMVHGRDNVTMYQQCYDEVCLNTKTDINFLNPDNEKVIMVPDMETFETTAGKISMNVTTCINLLVLVEALIRTKLEMTGEDGKTYHTALNPSTQRPFQPSVFAMLQRRLGTPIKLYRHYLNACATYGCQS